MKPIRLLLFFVILLVSAFRPVASDNVEFVCMKTHKATNICYFNFIIDGARYTYKDVGCKKSKKREETIKKVKEGKLALSRDWKIECGGN